MRLAVIIPARNAASLLEACLQAVLEQTRRPDEVLVVVAPSEDATWQLATSLAGGIVQVLHNPAGDRGSAINQALDSTDADLLAMVDAQARLNPDYLDAAERALSDNAVAVVGGPMRPRGNGAVGEAMAAALRSPFGVGDSQFHFEGEARDVDSVYLGVYRRTAFDLVGRYNPALLRTEDDDLNARIRAAGMRIRLDPAIRSVYQCRESLGAIWLQYYGYGLWKVALGSVRPAALRVRHLVPAAFVLALAITSALALTGRWLPLAALLAAWLLGAAAAALFAPADTMRARVLFPIVALTMHLAYGAGSLVGLLSVWRMRPEIEAAARAAGRRE